MWGVQETGKSSPDLAQNRLLGYCLGEPTPEIVGFGSSAGFDKEYCRRHPSAGICHPAQKAQSSAPSSSIPGEFRGVWMIVKEKKAPSCKSEEFESGSRDDLMSISGNEIAFGDWSCHPLKIATPDRFTMVCGGEGSTWKTEEKWSVQMLAAKKTLIILIMRRFNERDSLGKQVAQGEGGPYVPSIYEKCD
jgi:hypothetical protein